MKRFTIPAIVVLAVIAVLVTTGVAKKANSDHGWLGVYTQSVDYDLAEAFDLSVQFGAVINQVTDDSPAEKAGLKEGDVIIALNGEKITDSDDLNDVMTETKPGDRVSVLVNRDGKEQTITVEVAESPEVETFNWRHFDSSGHPKTWVFSSPSQSYIGIYLDNLTEQLAEFFGVAEGDGALITQVEKDSPAEEAGLKAGDVITRIDNETVEDASDVSELIADHEPGDQVNFTLVRDKREIQVPVTIDRRKMYGSGYNYFFAPDQPVFKVPEMHGLFNGSFPNNFNFELGEEFEQEMKQLAEEFAKLKLDIDEFKDERGPSNADRDAFRRDMEELRRELRNLKQELQRELESLKENRK